MLPHLYSSCDTVSGIQMLTEIYKGHHIEALPVLMNNQRFGVAVSISFHQTKRIYKDSSSISFILQIEAEKESIRFGKRLVDEIGIGL
jgi:hypothetical protein